MRFPIIELNHCYPQFSKILKQLHIKRTFTLFIQIIYYIRTNMGFLKTKSTVHFITAFTSNAKALENKD